MAMATLSSSSILFLSPLINFCTSSPSSSFSLSGFSPSLPWHRCFKFCASSSDVCAPHEPIIMDRSALIVDQAVTDDEFWAAACLRVRTFNEFREESSDIEDHKRYLAEREFRSLKKRVAGEREGFRTVSCINASLLLSHGLSLSQDLCDTCKFSGDGGDRVVVGTLDLIQCMRLPDEITGMKPSGITNLYVHVAVDNEPAKILYMKSGFIYESDEPEWQAKALNRPRRILLWFGLADPYNL